LQVDAYFQRPGNSHKRKTPAIARVLNLCESRLRRWPPRAEALRHMTAHIPMLCSCGAIAWTSAAISLVIEINALIVETLEK